MLQLPEIRASKRTIVRLTVVSLLVSTLCLVVAAWCWRDGVWWVAGLNTISLALNLQNMEQNVRMWLKLHATERRVRQ